MSPISSIIIQKGPCCWEYKGVALIDKIPNEEAVRLVDFLFVFVRKRVNHIHCFPDIRTLEIVWKEPEPSVCEWDLWMPHLDWLITHGVCKSMK